MTINDKLTEDFLIGIKEVESILLLLHFYPDSFNEKGSAYFIRYKKNKTIVEFIFGPSDWDIEMIIFTSKGKFAFKDLLRIPVIAKWVLDNRYIQENIRNVKNELFWYMELLKTALPIIE
jgi:hypothetical protein